MLAKAKQGSIKELKGVNMERRPTRSEKEPVFFTEISEAFESLRSSELTTQAELAKRDKNLAQLSDEIRTRGAQIGAELHVGLILAAANNEVVKHGMNSLRLLKRLQEIDEKLRIHNGKTIAWLSNEAVPSEGDQDQASPNIGIVNLLNIGILPPDAKIIVSPAGTFSVPVTHHISLKIADAEPDQELDFNENNIIPYGLHERGVVNQPEEIFLHLEKLLSSRRLMVIGNDEVAEMVKANQLGDDAYVYFATLALLESFRMTYPEDPELPPAA